jgi:hypothetical protein
LLLLPRPHGSRRAKPRSSPRGSNRNPILSSLAGTYVAKILGGTKPGDLPIEQASKFTFVVNLKTAKVLSIAVPPTLLTLADEVIE